MHRSIATSGQVKSAKSFFHFISIETMVSWRSKFNLTRFDCHSCIRRRILQLYSSKSIGCFGKYLKWPRSIAKCTMEFKRNCFIQNFILVLGVPLFELNFHNLLNYAPVVSVVLFPRIQSILMEWNGLLTVMVGHLRTWISLFYINQHKYYDKLSHFNILYILGWSLVVS